MPDLTSFVEQFAWLLILGGVLVFLLATYFGGVLHGRRAAAREDERQRSLALAIEEERRSEEREAELEPIRRRKLQHHNCEICHGGLQEWECQLLRSAERGQLEVDPPTDRSQLDGERD